MQQGIDHIRGSPYHPQSQGAVEAFNKTIQNFLYLAKDMNEDNFDLEESVLTFYCTIIVECTQQQSSHLMR